jgi:hypothetical protein
MIERACEIVEIPGGGLAALMPLADLNEQHWVAVKEDGAVLRSKGRMHLPAMAYRIAAQPWVEGWKPVGLRDVVVIEPATDFDLGGGD